MRVPGETACPSASAHIGNHLSVLVVRLAESSELCPAVPSYTADAGKYAVCADRPPRAGAPPAPVVSFDVLVDQETLVETQHTYPTAAFRNSEIQRRAKDDRLGQRSVQMLLKSQFERLAGEM